MGPVQILDSALLASALAESMQYSRPDSLQFDAVAAFPVSVLINTAGEFSSPLGPIFANIFLQTSAIPLGPQKGDLLTAAGNSIPDGVYLVQEVFRDYSAGNASLKIRKMVAD